MEVDFGCLEAGVAEDCFDHGIPGVGGTEIRILKGSIRRLHRFPQIRALQGGRDGVAFIAITRGSTIPVGRGQLPPTPGTCGGGGGRTNARNPCTPVV